MLELHTNTSLICTLKTRLAGLSEDSGDDVIIHNLALIRELGRPENMLRLLNDVLNDPGLLAQIAGRSYRHINQFDKVVLVDSDEDRGYRLTLHLWIPPYSEQESQEEMIHDHRFSFWSTIITGTLRSEHFYPDEGGVLLRNYRYTPQKKESSTIANVYAFVGSARLAQSRPAAKNAGGSYYLSYDKIHRVIFPAELTCTLVLRGPRRRSFSNIYNTSFPNQNTSTTNIMFTEFELVDKLSVLATAVQKMHS